MLKYDIEIRDYMTARQVLTCHIETKQPYLQEIMRFARSEMRAKQRHENAHLVALIDSATVHVHITLTTSGEFVYHVINYAG